MRQLKQFIIPLLVFLIIVCIAYLGIINFNKQGEMSIYTVEELKGIVVAYEDDEKGPIIVVRDLQSEKLFYFQFVNGVSEEIYGTEIKTIVEKKQYNVELLVYYRSTESDSVYEIDMVYIMDE